MRYRLLAILICAGMCFGLTACGEGEKPEETTSTERAVAVSNQKLKPDSVVISVGKTTVNMGEYRAYYYLMENPYKGLLGNEVWNYSKAGNNGKTLGQEAIEAVLRLIIQVKVICKEAAMQNVALGTDEKEQAAHNAKSVFDSLPDSVKKEYGIELRTMTRIFEENKLAQKMYHIEIGKVNANLAPEQIRAARVQLIYWKTDEKNRAGVKKKAEQVRQGLLNSKNNFYSVAKNNTEAAEIEMLIGSSDTRPALAKAVTGMKKGDISNVIEEKDGFYIAYCVQSSSKAIEEEYRNQVILEKQTQAFQKAYGSWSDKFEVKVSKALLAENK